MNPQTWVASGHVGGFSDPLIDCKQCKSRHRADKLIEDYNHANGIDLAVDGWSDDQLVAYIREKEVACPVCGARNFTDVRKFNLMFKTFQGVTEDTSTQLYLRPETAQGIFVNFKNVQRTTRRKIPFGICQIGKSFRNEITPGNFTFRTREFEQMELEFFCEPGTDLEWFAYWRNFCYQWLIDFGLKPEESVPVTMPRKNWPFYSKATTDFEFQFPFAGASSGASPIEPTTISSSILSTPVRTCPILTRRPTRNTSPMSSNLHSVPTGSSWPSCAQPTTKEEIAPGDVRTVLRFTPALAPIKVAILPLSAKLSAAAEPIYHKLSKKWFCEFDDRQSIGKRYAARTKSGTPYCVTFDFDSLEDQSVTIRERDSMQQVRVRIDELETWFSDKFN